MARRSRSEPSYVSSGRRRSIPEFSFCAITVRDSSTSLGMTQRLVEMEFEKNTLLFGADPTPRIVAVELGETGTVRVHRRETDGSTVTDVEPFHPFVWADSDVVDLGIETEKLRADLKFGWLITVDSWKELISLRNG